MAGRSKIGGDMDWISVNNKLPENLNDVLVKLGTGSITGGFYDGKWWPICVESTYDGCGVCVFNETVTHWKLLE